MVEQERAQPTFKYSESEITFVLKSLRQFARYRRQEVKPGVENMFVKMDEISDYKIACNNKTQLYWDAADIFQQVRIRNEWPADYHLTTLFDGIEEQWKESGLMFKKERDHVHEISFYMEIVEEALKVFFRQFFENN